MEESTVGIWSEPGSEQWEEKVNRRGIFLIGVNSRGVESTAKRVNREIVLLADLAMSLSLRLTLFTVDSNPLRLSQNIEKNFYS